MSLTSQQIDLIRASFEDIADAPDDAASVFYSDLFRRAPEVRSLFVEDMDRQGRKLVNTLGAVVAQLDMLDLLVPMLRDLALRHVAYGVQPDDYAKVGEALGTMITTCCKSMPDPDCTEAWSIAYDHLAHTMIALADEAISDGVSGATA